MRKRNSQKTSEIHLKQLETHFLKNQYPDGDERRQIAKTLGMHPKKVHIWFGNRRARWHSIKAENVNKETIRLKKINIENDLQMASQAIHPLRLLKSNTLDNLNNENKLFSVNKGKYYKKKNKDKFKKACKNKDNRCINVSSECINEDNECINEDNGSVINQINYEFKINGTIIKNQNIKMTNKEKLATIFTETSNFIKDYMLHVIMLDEISDQAFLYTAANCETKSIRQVKCCMEFIPSSTTQNANQ